MKTIKLFEEFSDKAPFNPGDVWVAVLGDGAGETFYTVLSSEDAQILSPVLKKLCKSSEEYYFFHSKVLKGDERFYGWDATKEKLRFVKSPFGTWMDENGEYHEDDKSDGETMFLPLIKNKIVSNDATDNDPEIKDIDKSDPQFGFGIEMDEE